MARRRFVLTFGRVHGRVALVLAGGAARGAYEVGVVQYILRELPRTLGHEVPLDILCGTSVGAINACLLAAHAHEPERRADLLAHAWTGLKLEQVARPSAGELVNVLRTLLGRKRAPPGRGETRRGGLLDPRGIEAVVHRGIAPGSIRRNLRAGRLWGVTVSTTNVATGKTVVFVDCAEADPTHWNRDPTVLFRLSELTADHALASAAVPPLFPAVRIGGDFYCDGGLRQNVPLSPARRLGADGLIVVNPRHVPPEAVPPAVGASNEAEYPGPIFLLGKAMNALLLDPIDSDLERLERINAILEAGTRQFGPDFVERLNAERGAQGTMHALRPLRTVHIRSSLDIGALALEYARSAEFGARSHGVVGKMIRRLADWTDGGGADFLSYVLFDGHFSARLIDLGQRDARAQHDELCAFFEALAPAPRKAAVG
jgi:NTE family protein